MFIVRFNISWTLYNSIQIKQFVTQKHYIKLMLLYLKISFNLKSKQKIIVNFV